MLIDLGNGCLVKDAKRYCITEESKRREHIKILTHCTRPHQWALCTKHK